MKKGIFEKIANDIKHILPVYDFGPAVRESDYNRGKDELILDIQRKRELTRILGRKVWLYFMSTFILGLFLTLSITVFYFADSEDRVTKRYMEQFGMRLEDMNPNNTEHIIENSEILVALSFLKDGEYEKGAILLSTFESEDAKWLEALCYVKTGNDIAAKAALRKIVNSKGDYSVSAQQILNNYYN